MSLDLFETELFAPLLVDRAGTISRAGQGWPALFGWPVDTLEGQSLVRIACETHQERITKALTHLGRGAPSAVVRVRVGREGLAERLVLRMSNQDQDILVVAEDITTRNQVLKRSASFQSLVDFTSDTWIVHDMSGRVRDANPWACRALGYTRDELLDLHIASIELTIKPGRLDGVWNRMEIGRPLTVEGRHRTKEGREFPVEVRLGLFETEDEEVLMLAVARDISARKEQEQRLTELNSQLQGMTHSLSEQVEARTAELHDALGRLSTTVEHLADGLCTIDAERRIDLVNPAMLTLLGRSDDITGRDGHEVLPQSVCDLIMTCKGSGEQTSADVSLPYDRIGRATATLLQDGTGVVLLLRDITLEREVDRMKTDFIATVSHELRTPLTSVMGFAKIMGQRLERRIFPHVPADDRRNQRAVEQVREHTAIILSEGERLTALINDVLDISKMEAGRMSWHIEAYDPVRLAQKAYHSVEGLFPPGGPMLVLDVPEELPEMYGDANRLHQVLINLLSNAAKFTEEGMVELGVKLVEGGVLFWVRDTGLGIPAGQLDDVFEKFKQVGDTLTSKPAGTGLGLPICRQIVQAHGGRIWAESVVGEGSVFQVDLPLEHPTLSDQPLPG